MFHTGLQYGLGLYWTGKEQLRLSLLVHTFYNALSSDTFSSSGDETRGQKKGGGSMKR